MILPTIYKSQVVKKTKWKEGWWKFLENCAVIDSLTVNLLHFHISHNESIGFYTYIVLGHFINGNTQTLELELFFPFSISTTELVPNHHHCLFIIMQVKSSEALNNSFIKISFFLIVLNVSLAWIFPKYRLIKK